MKILILGGTRFLGPALVEHALERGHTLTLFNRGKSNPHLFPDLEKLKGNRDPKIDEGLTALEGRRWDAVIDTSAYFPRWVRASAGLLAPNVTMYALISSISVYADFSKPVDESTPVGTLEDETVEEITNTTYGPLKALCEQAAEKAMPGRVANVRPGLIVGPRDNSDRFTYWPERLDRGGEVLAPGDPDARTQFIDVRDLAAFVVKLLEDGHPGVYNATGPDYPLTLQEVLHGCKCVVGKAATFTWVDESFLRDNEVGPWMEMPLWIPGNDQIGIRRTIVEKAVAHGLRFRPPADTIRDTLEWARTLPADREKRAGLAPDKERKVLAKWHARAEG